MTAHDPLDPRAHDPLGAVGAPGPGDAGPLGTTGAGGPREARRPPSPHPAPRPLSRRSLLGGAGTLALASALAACGGGGDPLARDGASAAGAAGAIVVGSQQYYSNEIIAELYAQAIEHAGLTVTRQYQIGQREIYLPELESGAISVLPEYGGNLLQYYAKDTGATDTDSILKALASALPAGLTVLDAAAATDQDSYAVTGDSAQKNGLASISDLAGLGRTVKVAANSEFATRPYGPEGLKRVYGVDAEVTPVEDSGGPLTVEALTDGQVDVADIYTSSPAIDDNGLVVLQDPQNLVLPQNVVPLVTRNLDAKAVQAINAVQAALTADALRALNKRSTGEQLDSATIAKDWLTAQGLLA